MIKNWKDTRILVIGAARQGLALARYFCRQGARVVLNDQHNAEQLADVCDSMSEWDVEWVTGGHPVDLLDGVDLVCPSGGVPLDLPILVEAARRGIRFSNDSQVFMESVPCQVIGITGSAGKTTTTTLVGRMAQAGVQSPRKVWIGGNIGQPLVEYLDAIQPIDLVVLELSSFQLELITRAPQIGAILNITPNHLDRHATLEAYTAAKARILKFQGSDDTAILGRDDPGAYALTGEIRGRLISFGLDQPTVGSGTFLRGDSLWLTTPSGEIELMPTSAIELRGEHNILNVLAACAIAHAAGLSPTAMLAGVKGFNGAPHRLELVRTLNGVRWYNDSIATAPERTMADIRSFDEPLVLLLGGRDKKLPWNDLADLIHRRVKHVIVFGEAAGLISEALGPLVPGRNPLTLTQSSRLNDAVQAAAHLVESGDVVLLAPGGTSFDEFKDFEERGECYRKWVNQLS